MEHRVVRIETKLEMIEETLKDTSTALKELIRLQTFNHEMDKRIKKLEDMQLRVTLGVIGALASGLLSLVLTKFY